MSHMYYLIWMMPVKYGAILMFIDLMGYLFYKRDHLGHLKVPIHYFTIINLLNLVTWLNSKLSLLYSKQKYNMLPENTQKLFKLCQDYHNYNTRYSVKGTFEVQFCRTRARSRSLSIKGVKLWNNLYSSYHTYKCIKQVKCIQEKY